MTATVAVALLLTLGVGLIWRLRTAYTDQRPGSANRLQQIEKQRQEAFQLQLRRADAEVSRLTALVGAGLASESDLQAAQDSVDLFRAQFEGNNIEVARARLAAAEHRFQNASESLKKGLIAASDYESAKSELDRCQTDLQAALSAQGGSDIFFGPIVERVLNAPASGVRSNAVRLADGAVSDLPESFTTLSDAERNHWLAETKVNLVPDYQGGNRWALALRNMDVAEVAEDHWQLLDAGELRQSLPALPWETVKPVLFGFRSFEFAKEMALPLTLAFRTTEGGCGLLQITGFVENPRGIRVHYKMAQARSAPGGEP